MTNSEHIIDAGGVLRWAICVARSRALSPKAAEYREEVRQFLVEYLIGCVANQRAVPIAERAAAWSVGRQAMALMLYWARSLITTFMLSPPAACAIFPSPR